MTFIKKEMLTYYAKEFYWNSELLQRGYSSIAHLQAKVSPNRFDKLKYVCDSARRVRAPQVRPWRLKQFGEFVQSEFAQRPPKTLLENPFVSAFLESSEGQRTRQTVESWDLEKRAKHAGNVIVLKAPSGEEKGVLLVHFIPHFQTFLVNFDIAKITQSFRLVLAPSWYLYPLPYWALFSSIEDPPVVSCFDEEVASVMRSTGMHLVPVAIGPQDWVDTTVFRPLERVKKDFDVVMVASFQRLKRHRVLFDAMRKLRTRRLRVALIGATWERTREEFDQEIAAYGVQDDCTVFQGLSSQQVNEVLNRSKVKVLLSKMEGGNRAVMEALAANTPCLIYEGLVGRRDLTPLSGMYTSDKDLARNLLYMVDHYRDFRARECFLSRSGARKTTDRLNAVLKTRAEALDEPWTRDIVGKLHKYAGLGYLSEEDEQSTQAGWAVLRQSLNCPAPDTMAAGSLLR